MKAKIWLAMGSAVAAAATIAIATDAPSAVTRAAARDAPPDRELIARGSQLAAIGNCAGCHTSPGGKPYAGGRAMQTPFGTLYSTNITPDAATGIGAWSAADFLRAMHEGVDRAGRHLYPAFPYDHFTRVTDEDVAAIYAFMTTRDPVQSTPPPNRLLFPMNLRPMLSAWKALYFDPGVYRPHPGQSAQWNRGAYLVDGLGHCGACHTPRNALGAEKKGEDLGGGDVEDWHGTALNASSPAPSPWTAEQLLHYLREGWDASHGTAAGPMKPVVHDLSQVAEDDVRAIATYLAWKMAPRGAIQPAAGAPVAGASAADSGAGLFAEACAGCHEASAAATPATRTVPLAYTSTLTAPDPRNAIHIVVDGIWPETGEKGALMPAFAGTFTREQMVALLSYLRAHYTTQPAWRDVDAQLRKLLERQDKP